METNNQILSVREQIANILRTDIIEGALAPNTKLNELELAERFGTSRGPIRDVLLKLTKEGLVVSKNNVGASVSSPLNMELQKLNIDVRRRIEEFAVRHLEGKLTAKNFEELERRIQVMQRHFDAEQITELKKADIAFHQYLVELAGGEDLLNMWYPIVMRMSMNYRRINTSVKLVDEHRDIVTALQNEDAKGAIAALRRNIS